MVRPHVLLFSAVPARVDLAARRLGDHGVAGIDHVWLNRQDRVLQSDKGASTLTPHAERPLPARAVAPTEVHRVAHSEAGVGDAGPVGRNTAYGRLNKYSL